MCIKLHHKSLRFGWIASLRMYLLIINPSLWQTLYFQIFKDVEGLIKDTSKHYIIYVHAYIFLYSVNKTFILYERFESTRQSQISSELTTKHSGTQVPVSKDQSHSHFRFDQVNEYNACVRAMGTQYDHGRNNSILK